MDRKIERLILKEDDVLVVKLPSHWFSRDIAKKIYGQIRKQLKPRKNKILLLPSEIEISVIGTKEVKEYISKIDLWDLWDDNEEINGD